MYATENKQRLKHPPPPNVEVRKASIYTSTPPCIFMAWRLVKYTIRFHGVVLS